MNVAVVGSSALNIGKVAGPLLSELTRLPSGTTVLLRSPAYGDPNAFERVAARMCAAIGFEVVWFKPDLDQYQGRAATYERDIRMAEAGEAVIAFFPEGETMLGGTGHVVEKFHDLDRRSECFTVYEDGTYKWTGGMEPVYSSP